MKMEGYRLKKAAAYWKHYGPARLAAKAAGRLLERDGYKNRWQEQQPDEAELSRQKQMKFPVMPVISILVPLYHTPEVYFTEMLQSVLEQSYSRWQLCLVDAGEKKLDTLLEKLAPGDERIVYRGIKNQGIAENTNEALALATGDYIVLLDHDDVLSREALYRMVEQLNRENADCLYSDEDKIDSGGTKHFCPHCKPDFDPVLLRTNNYICHLFMVKRDLALEAGGFSSSYDGAQDFDFILRCTEKAQKVVHVPYILYHWRTHSSSTAGNPLSKLYAYEAGKKAVEDHLARLGKTAKVTMLEDMGFYAVQYPDMPEEELPSVKIMILSKGGKRKTARYLHYLRQITDYPKVSFQCVRKLTYRNTEKKASKHAGCIIAVKQGTRVEAGWLRRLEAQRTGADAGAAAARQNKVGMIYYAGEADRDAFGNLHGKRGMPAWYKGRFNSCLLACSARTLPDTGVLMEESLFWEWVQCPETLQEVKAVYVPEVVLKQ